MNRQTSGPVRFARAGACALVMTGCSAEQLPVGATLAISPSERTFEITEFRDADGRCLVDGNRFVDLPVVLTLRDAAGAPIGGAWISVYVDFAANTLSGYAPLALFEDRNRNGVVDADSELVSGEGDAIARVTTDDVDGSHALLLRANLSCAYRSELVAFVGGIIATAAVEVSDREPPVANRGSDGPWVDTARSSTGSTS